MKLSIDELDLLYASVTDRKKLLFDQYINSEIADEVYYISLKRLNAILKRITKKMAKLNGEYDS